MRSSAEEPEEVNQSDTIKRMFPAFIRGCTHDGETGLIATTMERIHTPALIVENNGDIHRWRNSFIEYCTKTGTFPASIGLKGERWHIALGATIEEARACSGVSKLPGERFSGNRYEILKRKVALVTGAAQGFGKSIAEHLVKEGLFVYLADLNLSGATELAHSLNEACCHTVAVPLQVDVTSEASVESMVAEVSSITGALDVCVSNAGVLRAGSVKQMTLQDFQFVTSVDYTGFFLCTKHMANLLAWQNEGSGSRYLTDIVAISSKSGLQGSNKNAAYAGAKFGLNGLVQSFALELVADNIKVNAICPGNYLDGPLWSDPKNGLFVQYLAAGKIPSAKTVEDVRRHYEHQVPMKRGCQPEDVLRAIYYIVEQKYETGQAVPVTGGQVMLK
jgi:sorbitol-6-phosphate 2-dehydrogenase